MICASFSRIDDSGRIGWEKLPVAVQILTLGRSPQKASDGTDRLNLLDRAQRGFYTDPVSLVWRSRPPTRTRATKHCIRAGLDRLGHSPRACRIRYPQFRHLWRSSQRFCDVDTGCERDELLQRQL